MTMVWNEVHGSVAFTGQQTTVLTLAEKGGTILHAVNFNTHRPRAMCEIWKVASLTSVQIAKFDGRLPIPVVSVPFDIGAESFHIALDATQAPDPTTMIDVTILFK